MNSELKGRETTFLFLGNELWLDFINTEVVERGEPRDFLVTEDDWHQWLREAILGARNQKVSLREALELRKILRSMAQELTDGKAPKASAIKSLNLVLDQDSLSYELQKKDNGWSLKEKFEKGNPLAEIARSFSKFLVSPNVKLLRKCEAEECVLYFVDTSKNHKRRWCSMKTCGNRSKVSAFMERHASQRD